ncbi:MAG: CbtA family protein [Halobacteria archaeon]
MDSVLSRLSDPARLLPIFKTALAAGVLAGLVTASFHFAVTERAIDQAIAIEEAAAAAAGEAGEPLPYTRDQQKAGLFPAAVMLGISYSMVFGLVCSLFRERFARWGAVSSSLLLSSLVLGVAFLLPFAKYPGNPPAVGNPETIHFRTAIFIAFQLTAILAAALAFFLWARFRTRLGMRRSTLLGALTFAAVAGAGFILIPPNPDPVTAPPDLIASFRAFSVLGLAVLWLSIGLFFGLFWKRFSPRAPA